MGFYTDHILPYVLNVAMTTNAVKDERRRCLAPVAGDVLEVGFGSGLNLPFYPHAVTKVIGTLFSGVSIFVATDESRVGSSRSPRTTTVSPDVTSRPPTSRTDDGSCFAGAAGSCPTRRSCTALRTGSA